MIDSPDARPTRVRFLAVGSLCLAAAVAYIQRNSLSVAEQAVREDLGIDKETMGWVMGLFFLTYSIFQLPTGWLAKRYGTRSALSIFAAVFSAASAAFALATGYPMLAAARLSMGAAQAGIFPCCVNSIRKWMPETSRSTSAGFLAGAMSIGGALGTQLMGVGLANGWHWSTIYIWFSLPGFLFAGLFYWWFRDRPEDHHAVNSPERALIRSTFDPETTPTDAENDNIATPWRTILTNPAVLALCGQQFFRAVGYIFFATWFATYLRETRGVADLQVGFLNSLPLLAVVFASPFGGRISDWVLVKTGSRRWSRQGIAAISMTGCFLLILASWPVADPMLAVLLISGGSFVASFGGPCAYTATIDMGGRHVTMLFSLMNLSGNIGAFLFPVAVPYLLNEDPNVPGSGNWDLVLFVFAGIYLAAAICWLFADVNVTIDDDQASSAA